MQTNPPSFRHGIRNKLFRMNNRREMRTALPGKHEQGCKQGAFSLVEVVLALGVISFAFVALFGLLPVGLNAFNNSIDSTTEARIAETVVSLIKQQKFSQIYTQFSDAPDTPATNYPAFITSSGSTYPQPQIGFYFDDQGNMLGLIQSGSVALTSGTGTKAQASYITNNYVYTAEVQVYYHSQIPAGYQPSQTTSGTFTSSTSSIILQGGNNVQQPMATAVVTVRKISSPKTARVYTSYIDNNGL